MSAPQAPFRRSSHYVSRGYLKRWECAPGKIWTYRLLVPDERMPLWKEASIRGVAYREHLYTSVAADGDSDDLERWLAEEFEAPAEPAIHRAVSGQRLRTEDWRCLIRFWAAQDVRTPARFQEAIDRWASTMPEVLQRSVKVSLQRFETMSAEERKAISAPASLFAGMPIRVTIEDGGDNVRGFIKAETIAGRGMWVSSIRHLLTSTIRVLYRHRWTILRAPDGIRFPTSDDPVLKLNFNGRDNYSFDGGWGSPGTELWLPLSPSHALYTQIGRSVPARDTVLESRQASIVSRLLCEHAHRSVFAVAPDDGVTACRPRTVSAELVRTEAEQWQKLHQEHSDAERQLMGWRSAVAPHTSDDCTA